MILKRRSNRPIVLVSLERTYDQENRELRGKNGGCERKPLRLLLEWGSGFLIASVSLNVGNFSKKGRSKIPAREWRVS